MGKALLNKEHLQKMKEIFTLYIEDVDNLKDEDGRYKTYQQVRRDLKGLVSLFIIKRMLKELNPGLAQAMSTSRKKKNRRMF